MIRKSSVVAAVALAAVAFAVLHESPAAKLARLQSRYGAVAAELGAACPYAAPEDRLAFDRCRKSLFGESRLRAELPERMLWGRARGKPLKDTPLTEFAPDVYAGLYAPLFMFEGRAEVSYDEGERLYKATLPVRFRNRLAPGLFPYPFWHDKTKWGAYQSATALVFYLRPGDGRIKAAQFQPGVVDAALAAQVDSDVAAFDGQWLWTDAEGRTQPQVTLFDGLYDAANPHLQQIDSRYRELALELREGECNDCHVPRNPKKIERLVLLQTPAHAAGEIKRILRSVRSGEMPEDENGHEKPLPPAVKARLLAKAEAFDAVLSEARAWEANKAATRR
ncbi:MAG: hypothetical protein NTZ11_07450 [Gammaproteobacteria bacterium]|nr:hypothetical protein [Gammaproteobacteria bacterium]